MKIIFSWRSLEEIGCVDPAILPYEEELIYFGIVLFGSWAEVSELTRKFSLWK